MKEDNIVSCQCAGMPEPEYGTFIRSGYTPGYAFIHFEGEERPRIVDMAFCQMGRVPSWWSQDENGRWRSDRTPRR